MPRFHQTTAVILGRKISKFNLSLISFSTLSQFKLQKFYRISGFPLPSTLFPRGHQREVTVKKRGWCKTRKRNARNKTHFQDLGRCHNNSGAGPNATTPRRPSQPLQHERRSRIRRHRKKINKLKQGRWRKQVRSPVMITKRWFANAKRGSAQTLPVTTKTDGKLKSVLLTR